MSVRKHQLSTSAKYVAAHFDWTILRHECGYCIFSARMSRFPVSSLLSVFFQDRPESLPPTLTSFSVSVREKHKHSMMRPSPCLTVGIVDQIELKRFQLLRIGI